MEFIQSIHFSKKSCENTSFTRNKVFCGNNMNSMKHIIHQLKELHCRTLSLMLLWFFFFWFEKTLHQKRSESQLRKRFLLLLNKFLFFVFRKKSRSINISSSTSWTLVVSPEKQLMIALCMKQSQGLNQMKTSRNSYLDDNPRRHSIIPTSRFVLHSMKICSSLNKQTADRITNSSDFE